MSYVPKTVHGRWLTDAPLTDEQVRTDLALLRRWAPPDEIIVRSAKVFVNGRIWFWQSRLEEKVFVNSGPSNREQVPA